MYQVVHHQLVASAKVVALGHQINPDFQIGCMMACVPLYPFSCKPEDMMYSVESMHDRYLFSDVHVEVSIRLMQLRSGNVKDLILIWNQKIKKSLEMEQ